MATDGDLWASLICTMKVPHFAGTFVQFLRICFKMMSHLFLKYERLSERERSNSASYNTTSLPAVMESRNFSERGTFTAKRRWTELRDKTCHESETGDEATPAFQDVFLRFFHNTLFDFGCLRFTADGVVTVTPRWSEVSFQCVLTLCCFCRRRFLPNRRRTRRSPSPRFSSGGQTSYIRALSSQRGGWRKCRSALLFKSSCIRVCTPQSGDTRSRFHDDGARHVDILCNFSSLGT